MKLTFDINLNVTLAPSPALIDTVRKLSKLIMDAQELVTRLDAANARTEKIIGEVRALLDALANAGQLPAAVTERMEALESTLQRADDLNPDATPPTDPNA